MYILCFHFKHDILCKVQISHITPGLKTQEQNNIYAQNVDTWSVTVSTQKDKVTVQQCGEIHSRKYEY